MVDYEDFTQTDFDPEIADETLPLIAPALVKLHQLEIISAVPSPNPSTCIALAESLGQSLRVLRLEQYATQTTVDFARFITSFPLLEKLVLMDFEALDESDTTPITLPIPPSFRIKHLTLRSVDLCGKFLRWFSEMDRHPQLSIRSFEVQITYENRIAVGQFLRRLGPVLEEYTISIRQFPIGSDVVGA